MYESHQLEYTPLRPLLRVVNGHEPKQRPRDFEVKPLQEHQFDNVYQTAHVGQISAEMVRPDVTGEAWGGYDVEKLRMAGLARAIQMRLPYLLLQSGVLPQRSFLVQVLLPLALSTVPML